MHHLANVDNLAIKADYSRSGDDIYYVADGKDKISSYLTYDQAKQIISNLTVVWAKAKAGAM